MCFQIKSPYLGDAREVQEQEDICILMAGSCCCLAETNKIPYSNYPSIKNIFKKNPYYTHFKTLSQCEWT